MTDPSVVTDEQRAAVAWSLLKCMEWISEDEWRAGWDYGIEYRLWADAQRGDRPHLAALAELAGGWWRWDDERASSSGPVFVPLDEWRAMVRERES